MSLSPLASPLLSLALPLRNALRQPIWQWQWQWQRSTAIALPAIALNIPGLLSELWDSVLRAAPKKKTSYGKKRSRQLAGKALKDNIAINKCPACGALKRSHMLCPDCVAKIRERWRKQDETNPDALL